VTFFGLPGPLGLFVLAKLLLGGNGGGGGASTVPTGPFPVSPPPLPPFPSGWCPEDPPAPEVVARGWALLPTLWQGGAGTRRVELVGDRWITFVATMQDGTEGVAAYRSVDCPAVVTPTSTPVPVPGAPTPASAPATSDAALMQAIAMNEALKLRGYKQTDMPTYQAFQRAAALGVDGFPGVVTMLKLESVLKSGGLTMAPVKVYPWKKTGAYDGVNAPTLAEWTGATGAAAAQQAAQAAPSTAAPPAASSPAASSIFTAAAPAPRAPPPPQVSPYPGVGAYKTNSAYVSRYQNALTYLASVMKRPAWSPQGVDGKFGPKTQAGVKAFQTDQGLKPVDGFAGAATAAAIDRALIAAQSMAA
jgi:peptidoglycan hydrolase-like protein with peptidoglycan-binding domain